MSPRQRKFRLSARQYRFWPRLSTSNDERARRYNTLRAFGYSRAAAISLRDISTARYMSIVSRLESGQVLTG